MQWEVVIGLEVHVQLTTQSKIFSGAAASYGAEPNRQACAVDLAMPGMLPVFNGEALRKAVRFGLAIGADINHVSVFDRKNYFYPDLPKGYQISQLDFPIVERGYLEIQTEQGSRRIGVTRAHLEEDAGKSLHEDFHGQTGLDLNRAGTPLLEVVSEPDLRSAAEAVAYLRQLHELVTYLDICDGDMSQGSLRCDCNVSLRPAGQQELGTRTEIKNVNSFRFVEKAILVEIERQQDILEEGGKIRQETRLYDPDRDETRPMRSKEDANDYRYFPDPDLLPIHIDDSWIAEVRSTLPELPGARRARFQTTHGLSEYDANVLTATRKMADYFEAVAARAGDAKLAANWIMGDLSRQLNASNLDIDGCPVSAEKLGTLLLRIQDGTLSGNLARTAFAALWDAPSSDVDELISARGLKQVTDTSEIEQLISQVLEKNAAQVEQYRQSPAEKRGKMLGFFVGQAMQASRGKADPKQVNSILRDRLDQG